MSTYSTRKDTAKARRETLVRRQARELKYGGAW